MNDMTFEELLDINCFSDHAAERKKAADLLELRYCCEIRCADMDKSVRFAHHARGCTIVAAKICRNVVIFQNVTIGSNQRFNKVTNRWENIGSPILADNVIVADGARVLGPILIGEHTVIGAGAIVTRDIPANCVAYGVNRYRPRNPDHDLLIGPYNISGQEILNIDAERVAQFNRSREGKPT